MDDCWERSIPFMSLTPESLKEVFGSFNQSKVIKLNPISIGCRNSNYQVITSKGDYLLRICVGDSNNEIIVSKALDGLIKIPKLLKAGIVNNRNYLIYEYIHSKSMQSLHNKNKLSDDLLYQVAKSAALIHQVNKSDMNGLIEMNLPPFLSWYELFLNNPMLQERLGLEIVENVKQLVDDKHELLIEIDKYQSFIHSDFRPANMLVDLNQNVYIVDWEYCGFGHTLADVGQFFRYGSYFNSHHIQYFEQVYNKYAKIKLPENWFMLAKLRDLINPLQMIGAKGNLPLKYQDLKNIIVETLSYFKKG